MCIRPPQIRIENPAGPPFIFPGLCRRCWQCNKNRVEDYVGRSLAERSESEATVAVTLTYAKRDDLAETIVRPEHFQRFIRAIRRKGTLVRYLGVAEKGERKGRVHFHAILFFHTPPPDWPQQQRFHIPEWPHGHVYADWVTDHADPARSLRYVCKYLLKGQSLWYTLSKKPPIGWAYFEKLAAGYVKAGVLPTRLEYMVPGSDRVFKMTGTTRRNFLQLLVREFDQRGSSAVWRLSQNVEQAVDSMERWRVAREEAGIDVSADFNALALDLERRRPDPDKVAAQLRAIEILYAWADFERGEEDGQTEEQYWR